MTQAFEANHQYYTNLTVDALRLQKVLKWTGSKSVTLYRQHKPLRGTTESGDLLVIRPIRSAA